MSQGRSVYRTIWKNFIASLTPKQFKEKCMGTDYMGTKYYELQSTEHSYSRKPRRWFVPLEKENFKQDIPVEWQAWLHHKRKMPPSEEEIQLNIMQMKQIIENAKKLETKKSIPVDETRSINKHAFPVYEDLEQQPGEHLLKK